MFMSAERSPKGFPVSTAKNAKGAKMSEAEAYKLRR
jgi:hypothetical protein